MSAAEWQRDSLSASPLDNHPSTRQLPRWVPHRIGPRFHWLDHNHILVIDGPLSERRFEVATDIRTDTVVLRLREDGMFAGQVRIERDPPRKGIILSNAAVAQRLRRGGLAAIMTWCALRELLTIQESATFRIRMVRPIRRRADDAGACNIGIGVIAARLGLRPDLPIERLLSGDNIAGIAALPGSNDGPPALRITLRCFPFVLVALVLSPHTMRPISDCRLYLHLKQDGREIQNWLRHGLLLVSGDYRLAESGIERFVNALATDEEEAAQFRTKVQPL